MKFFGTAEQLRERLREELGQETEQIGIYNLSNEYAILNIPEVLVEQVAGVPEIEYMEKPKRLFFAVENGIRNSCINVLQAKAAGDSSLTGRGVILAVIDSGIDYTHPDFRNADGSSRDPLLCGIRHLERYLKKEELDQALAQDTEQRRYEICPSRDLSGHGTIVAGIAAGNGRASEGRYRGVAYESSLLVVKLGTPGENGFPRTTELMSAVDFCIGRARKERLPGRVEYQFWK